MQEYNLNQQAQQPEVEQSTENNQQTQQPQQEIPTDFSQAPNLNNPQFTHTPQLPQDQQQAQQTLQNPNATPDEVVIAKQILGLDHLEQTIQQLQQQQMELQRERTKAQIQQMYPNVPFDLVEKEIEKVKQINPTLAEQMQYNPQLMEIAVKAVLADIKPNQQPDKITEGAGSAETPQDDLADKIKKGEANEIGLGGYILSISQR